MVFSIVEWSGSREQRLTLADTLLQRVATGSEAAVRTPPVRLATIKANFYIANTQFHRAAKMRLLLSSLSLSFCPSSAQFC